MRLRWSIPLPCPLSVGGSMRPTGGRGRSSGTGAILTGLLKLAAYAVVAEAWAAWWSLKVWYALGVLVHRRVTGQPTPIWRSPRRLVAGRAPPLTPRPQ